MIGAGAVGAACASALARAGQRVRVFGVPERSTTAVSGGHLLAQSKRPGVPLEMALRSLELLAGFAAGQEEELGYRQRGSLILAISQEECDLLRAHFDVLRESGLPVEWLDGAAARELEPGLSPSVRAATFCHLDAQVDPARLAGAWLQDALAHGAAIKSGAEVQSFIRSGKAVCGVVAGGMPYAASAVVLAAGPWSGALAEMAGLSLEIRPRRGVLLASGPGSELASRPLLGAEYLRAKFTDEAGVAFSFQQHPEGECLLGGSREFAGFSSEGIDEVAEQVLVCAARYLPAVAGREWTGRRAGFRPWTPSGAPHVGASPIPGLFLACGHEGDGITLAAATAEQVARAVAGG